MCQPQRRYRRSWHADRSEWPSRGCLARFSILANFGGSHSELFQFFRQVFARMYFTAEDFGIAASVMVSFRYTMPLLRARSWRLEKAASKKLPAGAFLPVPTG